MRFFWTMLISALTGIGGHFLNRRWDRALLFFGLIFLWGVGGLYLMTWFVLPTMPVDTPEQFQEAFRLLFRVISGGIGVIWLLSLFVTWRDVRRNAPLFKRWTVSGAVGALMLTLICCGYIFVQGYSLYRMTLQPVNVPAESADVGGEEFEALAGEAQNFWQYQNFGGLRGTSQDLPAPPEGAGTLRGRFLFEGEPAAGVALTVTLNGQFETEKLVTDEDGYFTLALPPGEWLVNLVKTTSWPDKPAGNSFLLVSGHEEKLVTGQDYERHGWVRSPGLKMHVAEDASASDTLTLQIKEKVGLVWPPAAGDSRATVDASVVEWQPYPEAENYLVKVIGMKREGTTTYFEHLAAREVSGNNRLALSTLTTVDGGDPKKQYQVRVYAFAPDGSYLGESEDFSDSATFRLADGQKIVEERSLKTFPAPLSPEEIETLGQNRKYLDAVKVLIDTDMLDAAGRLLNRVEGVSPPGRRKAMTGYLLARKGECAAARKAFSEARREDEEVCILAEYYQGCGAE